jgi:polysaccharide biosynthesis/export protein
MRILVVTALALTLLGPGAALAQTGSSRTQPPKPKPPATRPAVPGPKVPAVPGPKAPAAAAASVPTDPGFTIGPEDVLGILFWRDQEMSGDVTVRPDGMITLPLIRDVKAVGLTPTQLADRIQEAVREYVTDASVTVVVRQMNSRKAFITGEVARPGAYPLGSSSMTVMQLIAVAGGLTEFAQAKSISVMRVEAGKTRTFAFDYRNVAKGKKPEQNMVLKPGDTVVVPER